MPAPAACRYVAPTALRCRRGEGDGDGKPRNVLTSGRSLSHARLASVLRRGSTPPARAGAAAAAGASGSAASQE